MATELRQGNTVFKLINNYAFLIFLMQLSKNYVKNLKYPQKTLPQIVYTQIVYWDQNNSNGYPQCFKIQLS